MQRAMQALDVTNKTLHARPHVYGRFPKSRARSGSVTRFDLYSAGRRPPHLPGEGVGPAALGFMSQLLQHEGKISWSSVGAYSTAGRPRWGWRPGFRKRPAGNPGWNTPTTWPREARHQSSRPNYADRTSCAREGQKEGPQLRLLPHSPTRPPACAERMAGAADVRPGD